MSPFITVEVFSRKMNGKTETGERKMEAGKRRMERHRISKFNVSMNVD